MPTTGKGSLRYAVHAYAWKAHWSNDTLHLIDHAKELGFDLIEIPLMEIEHVDAKAIKERLNRVGLDVCTSTACSESQDITGEEEKTRRDGVRYLIECVEKTAAMGGTTFSGVIYSAIGRQIDGKPGDTYWERAAAGLRQVARAAQSEGITIGIEPINRYESFLVNTCDQALRLRDMIGEPNVAIHLDAYHMNIEESDFYHPTLKAAPYLCHYHLSESHRGVPGTGTVDWEEIYRALGESNYRGVVGLESFTEVSGAMRAATCIWRELAPSSDYLLTEGLKYLKGMEKKWYSQR
jgi:D-psicose/D-tagatose/L-ribulose 3-epimerase